MKKSISQAVIKGLALLALMPASYSAFAGVDGGIEYRVAWDANANRYRVYGRPTATPDKDLSMTAQVTLRVPHATGADKFTMADLQFKSGTTWALSSEVFAPVEDRTVDYLSFTYSPLNVRAFQFQAGVEQEMFSFTNTGPCMGSIELLNNQTDPFNDPPESPDNSVDTNPGNQFSNAGWGTTGDNDYLGNYGGPATCQSTGTNTAPIANDDSATTTADSAVTINVLGNDTDADNDTLTIDNYSNPSNGSVAIQNGQLAYTPNTGFTGSDSFTYTVSDGTATNNATVNITVTPKQPSNTPPVANNDTATTPAGNSVIVPVLTNDTDADGDTLNVTNYTAGNNGTVVLQNGNPMYTPNAGFTGSDSFTYTVSDGTDTDTATVTVTVTQSNTNNAPVAQNDTATTTTGNSVIVDVMANDSDADGDTLTVTNYSAGSNGTVTLENGKPMYTPNAGFTGTDSFTYTVSDGTDTATATVTVTVTSGQTNNPPVAQDDTATTTASSSVIVDVLTNDTDADNDTLTVTNYSAGNNGTVTLENGKPMYTPNAGFTGTDSFTYTVSDGTDTDTATVTVTVSNSQGGNNPPVAQNDTATTEESSSVIVDVLANDSDADGDTLSVTNYTAGSNGTVTLHEGKPMYTPYAGFSGTDTFSYTVSDGTDTATATVTVTVNDKIVVLTAKPDNFLVSPGSTNNRLDVLANDKIPDAINVGLEITKLPQYGTAFVQDNKLTYVPSSSYTGSDELEYRITGPDNASSEAKVTLSIKPDSDNDGLSDEDEKTLGTDPNKADTDGDGVSDKEEVGDDINNPQNTDGDDKINALDPDDDNDGLFTKEESYSGSPQTTNTDGDSMPDYLDKDDDNDGIPTASEQADNNGNGRPEDAVDSNNNGKPDYLDSHTVVPPVDSVAVPTLTQWAQILLSMLLGFVALRSKYSKLSKN